MQIAVEAWHVLRNERAVGADRVASKRRLPRLRDETLDVLEGLELCLRGGYAVRDLFEQARRTVHFRDELAHVRERACIGLHHDLESRIERTELEVGHDDRDFNDFVEIEVEPRHLAVDPYQTVIFACRSHR